MSNVSYAQLLEDRLREILSDRHGVLLSTSNKWLIDQIETLINGYPELQKLDLYRLTLPELYSAIENLCGGASAVYNEQYDVLFVEAVVEETFFNRTTFILIFLLCVLAGISLFKVKASHEYIDSLSYRDAIYFDDFISNSKIINDLEKKAYYFNTSIYSIFHFIYFLQDEKLEKYGSRKTKEGVYKNMPMAEYIKIKSEKVVINDPFLDIYINNFPDFKKDSGSLTFRDKKKLD